MSNNYVYYTALINIDGSSVPAYEFEVEPDFVFINFVNSFKFKSSDKNKLSLAITQRPHVLIPSCSF